MLDRPNIFTIDRRRIDETTTELSLYGELDLGVAPDLHEALHSASGNVVVDLGRCEFIDSPA